MSDRVPDRNDVRFPFAASVVLKAARTRAGYHRKRLDWWQDELDKANLALEASMQLREQQITGGTRKVAVFDEEKQQRVSECTHKVSQHRADARGFEAWVAGLIALGSDLISLSIADISFFQLAEQVEPGCDGCECGGQCS